MKKLALISLFLAQSVLANDWDDPYKPFNARKNEHKTVSITWLVVDDIRQACHKEHNRRGFAAMKVYPDIDACSFWEDNKCTIITKKNPTMHDVGHEVRHCFQGNWH
jgi:hypothetical protein